MRVLIKLEGFVPGHHAGTENFVYSLIRGLTLACPDVQLCLQVSPESIQAFKDVLAGIRVTYLGDERTGLHAQHGDSRTVLRIGRRLFYATPLGKHLLNRRRTEWDDQCESDVDVVWYPTWRLPTYKHRKPVVMTIHDFRWFERSEGGGELQALLRRAAPTAVVTSWPDPFSRLCRLFPEMQGRAFMIPFVFDPTNTDRDVCEATLPRSMVYASSNGKEKNHEKLIEALGLLRRAGKQHVRIFCPGPMSPERTRILNELIRREGVADWIYFLGWVPREFVHWLYDNAAAVITTSSYEAMSGTVLEAWQHGKPVACSRIPSIVAMTELLGAKVRFFDQTRSEDISEGIEDLFDNIETFRAGARLARTLMARITQGATAEHYRDVFSWAGGQSGRPEWYPYHKWWESTSESGRTPGSAGVAAVV
jgi:glycosyltransferase involved in cell wall biosynthesis